MANVLPPKSKQKIIAGSLGGSGGFTTTNAVRALLIADTYTYDSADEFLDDVKDDGGGGHTVTAAVALTGITFTDGVFNCDPIVFPDVAEGTTYKALIVYMHTGSDATADYIGYHDSAGGDLPKSGNGGDITVTPDPTNGLFKI